MATFTPIVTGDNVTYIADTTTASSINVTRKPNGQIYRTALTANSIDVLPSTTDLMNSFFDNTASGTSDYDNSSFVLSITNNSDSFTITQQLGAGQALFPAGFPGSYSPGTITVPGTGYTSGSTTGTGATSGATMTVTFTDTAGAVTSIDSVDSINTGTFIAGESIVLTGGSGTAAFNLIISDTILPGQARLYDFVVVDGTIPSMDVIIRSDNSSEVTGINLSSGDILIGQTNGQASGVSPSGDISTISTAGAFTANSATVALLAGAQTFTGDKTFGAVANFGGAAGEFRLVETADGNTEYIGLTAPTDVTTTYTLTLPGTVGTSGQVLQTVDAAGTFGWVTPSTGALSYYYANGPPANVAITDTPTTVDIDTSPISGGGTFTNTNGTIEVPTAGDYKISFTVQFQSLNQAGGQRASFGAEVFVAGVAITGTLVECYIREQNNTSIRPSVTKVILVTIGTPATDLITIRAYRTIGTTTGNVTSDQATIAIEQMS